MIRSCRLRQCLNYEFLPLPKSVGLVCNRRQQAFRHYSTGERSAPAVLKRRRSPSPRDLRAGRQAQDPVKRGSFRSDTKTSYGHAFKHHGIPLKEAIAVSKAADTLLSQLPVVKSTQDERASPGTLSNKSRANGMKRPKSSVDRVEKSTDISSILHRLLCHLNSHDDLTERTELDAVIVLYFDPDQLVVKTGQVEPEQTYKFGGPDDPFFKEEGRLIVLNRALEPHQQQIFTDLNVELPEPGPLERRLNLELWKDLRGMVDSRKQSLDNIGLKLVFKHSEMLTPSFDKQFAIPIPQLLKGGEERYMMVHIGHLNEQVKSSIPSVVEQNVMLNQINTTLPKIINTVQPRETDLKDPELVKRSDEALPHSSSLEKLEGTETARPRPTGKLGIRDLSGEAIRNKKIDSFAMEINRVLPKPLNTDQPWATYIFCHAMYIENQLNKGQTLEYFGLDKDWDPKVFTRKQQRLESLGDASLWCWTKFWILRAYPKLPGHEAEAYMRKHLSANFQNHLAMKFNFKGLLKKPNGIIEDFNCCDKSSEGIEWDIQAYSNSLEMYIGALAVQNSSYRNEFFDGDYSPKSGDHKDQSLCDILQKHTSADMMDPEIEKWYISLLKPYMATYKQIYAVAVEKEPLNHSIAEMNDWPDKEPGSVYKEAFNSTARLLGFFKEIDDAYKDMHSCNLALSERLERSTEQVAELETRAMDQDKERIKSKEEASKKDEQIVELTTQILELEQSLAKMKEAKTTKTKSNHEEPAESSMESTDMNRLLVEGHTESPTIFVHDNPAALERQQPNDDHTPKIQYTPIAQNKLTSKKIVSNHRKISPFYQKMSDKELVAQGRNYKPIPRIPELYAPSKDRKLVTLRYKLKTNFNTRHSICTTRKSDPFDQSEPDPHLIDWSDIVPLSSQVTKSYMRGMTRALGEDVDNVIECVSMSSLNHYPIMRDLLHDKEFIHYVRDDEKQKIVPVAYYKTFRTRTPKKL